MPRAHPEMRLPDGYSLAYLFKKPHDKTRYAAIWRDADDAILWVTLDTMCFDEPEIFVDWFETGLRAQKENQC